MVGENRIEGRLAGVVRSRRSIGRRQHIRLIVGDKAGKHRRNAGLLLDRLLPVEIGGDLDFLALDLRLHEGGLVLEIEARVEQQLRALENGAGGKILRRLHLLDSDNAALLGFAVHAVFVRRVLVALAFGDKGDLAAIR